MSTFEDKKNILRRMKSMKKFLGSLASTLENPIQVLEGHVRLQSRVDGFASLPDELLARVFELYYEEYAVHLGEENSTHASPHILACVSSRFRRIALRLPSLWERTSVLFHPERVQLLKSRCQKPSVHFFSSDMTMFRGDREASEEIRDFIRAIHPSQQWRTLSVEYDFDCDGTRILEAIDARVANPFTSLESLSLHNVGFLDDEEPDGLKNISGGPVLETWNMPILTTLKLCNVLPQRINCPALRFCDIALHKDRQSHGIFRWDLGMLKHTLRELDAIESLSLSLCAASFYVGDAGDHPVKLPKLRSLSLKVGDGTNPLALNLFSSMMDAPNLAKLELELEHSRRDTEPSEFIKAFFKHNNSHVPSMHPNVEEFILIVSESHRVGLPYETIFRALPRVRKLSMSLPGFSPSGMFSCKDHGCLRDLRSMQIKLCNPSLFRVLNKLLTSLEEEGSLSQFERLELQSCCESPSNRASREWLQHRLGKKLV